MQRLAAIFPCLLNRLVFTEPSSFVGELIEACQKPPGRTSSQQDPVVITNDENGSLFNPPRLFDGHDGQLSRPVHGCCPAAVLQGTFSASGCAAWYTDAGSQVHQGLVEVSGTVLRHPVHKIRFRSSCCGRCFDLLFIEGEPGKNPEQVSVDCRDFLPESYGSDSGSRVGSDPGQPDQLCGCPGHLPFVL